MSPLAMIAEWQKGCSCAGPEYDKIYHPKHPTSPSECSDCTEGLIESLEKVLREPNEGMENAGMAEADKLSFGVVVAPIWKAMAGVKPE